MAGLVGMVAPRETELALMAEVEQMFPNGSIMSHEWRSSAGAVIGAVFRRAINMDLCFDPEKKLIVGVYGFPVRKRNGDWRRVTARELVRDYSDGGFHGVLEIDGSFHLVAIDLALGKSIVATDRFGTVPIFYATDKGRLAFGPEMKIPLRLLDITPTLSRTGVQQFLNVGFPFGSNTILSGVSRLRPGYLLVFEHSSGDLQIQKYWEMHFSTDNSLTENAAGQLLFEAIGDAQKALAPFDPRNIGIALTGGWDSRIVAGTLNRREDVDFNAYTWGALGTLPFSDPVVAAEVAAICNIPHFFLPYSSSSAVKHSKKWTTVSECLSDNMGFYAAGADFLVEAGHSPDVMLIGDHVVGLSGLPRTWGEGVEKVLQIPSTGILPQLRNLLRNGSVADVIDATISEASKIVGREEEEDPKAAQDRLFAEIQSPGWLFSPAFYREPVMPAFRPMMLNGVTEIVERLPRHLRADKAIIVKIVKRYFPKLSGIPIASSNSLIDWKYDSRENNDLRNFLRDYTDPELLQATILGEFFDVDKLVRVRKSFFTEMPRPVGRGSSKAAALIRLRRLLARTAVTASLASTAGVLARRYLKIGTVAQSIASPSRVLFRLALLNQFIEGFGKTYCDPQIVE